MASPSEAATDAQRTASAAGKTDVGRRRDHNEDQVLVSHELGLYAVADGMGGHSAGDVASSIAAAALEEFFWEEQDVGDDIEGLDGLADGAVRLVKAVHHCNREVFSRSGRSANQGGMGSTVVAVHVDEEAEVIHIVHVGDSRCYRIRHEEIELMTADHSMINEALRLNPNLSDDILRQLPSNVVTRALGTKENVQPDVRTEPLCKGDLYLLCSDGLSGEVADEDLLFGVLESEDLEDGCELLVAMANEAGGRDNISAVLVRVDKGKTPPPPGAEPRLVKSEESDVEVDVHDDDQLDDADLDDWLAEPSDPGDEEPPDEDDDEDGGSIEMGEDVIFSDPPPAPDDAKESADEEDQQEEPEIREEDSDLDDELDELYGEDDEDDEVVLEVSEEEDDELPSDRESLSALSPAFGNAPPRLRRPSSVPPEATPDEEDSTEIKVLPVMGIGDSEPPPPTPAESRKRCHHCGHRLLPDERYCGLCGTRTREPGEVDPSYPTCDACGTEVIDDTRFCVECGVRL
jgi:protein phosphatase